jgi:hypothetical protein
MSQELTNGVHFVGSVPSETTEDVFRRCAAAVGSRAFAFPDGELGPRQMWIGGLGDLVFSKHPDLERMPDGPVPLFGNYAPRDGANVSFDDLYPYPAFALESYKTFRRLRDNGELPAGARFQVSLPTPDAAIRPFFSDLTHWPDLMAAWARAMRHGYDTLLAEIPAEDLVVQLDYCTEFVDISGDFDETHPFPDRSREERIRQNTDPSYLAAMTENLPETVTLGYHVCLGTFPHWPLSPQEDLSLVVEVANLLIEGTPRRVDFLHLPATSDVGEDYFAPLRDLTPGPKVFLGIECGDGPDELRRRTAAAHKHLADFGIAHFCGYGREMAGQIDKLLGDLAAGADSLQGEA